MGAASHVLYDDADTDADVPKNGTNVPKTGTTEHIKDMTYEEYNARFDRVGKVGAK